MAANPRRTNGHRRNQVRARVLAEEDDCWLCGQPVDKTLKTPHPGSPEVDEVVPVSLGGDPYARANCRLAHRQPPVQCATRQRHTQRTSNTRHRDIRNVSIMVTPAPTPEA